MSGNPRREPWSVLDALERAPLGLAESPVEEWTADDVSIWVKRDDLNAPVMGGNKVRALELLLAGVGPGDVVSTIGGVGSTHILATAVHASRLGASTRCWRWPHELHAVAQAVSERIAATCDSAPLLDSFVHVLYASARRQRLHNERWIPFGGTSPTGMVGHFAAGRELAHQVERAQCPTPGAVYVPLGTGGTAVGLAMGLATAGVDTQVMAVRCGPRLGVDDARLAWLGFRLRRHLMGLGVSSRHVRSASPIIVHDVYAGAYARPHAGAEALAARLRPPLGPGLDATYSAKACYAAVRRAGSTAAPVMFWHTFDARWLRPDP